MTSSTTAEADSLLAAGRAGTKARLGAITRELHDALRELGAEPELQRVVREMPDARSRLSYVGEMTEKAAHRVLNLVDQAMPALDAHGLQARQVVEAFDREAALLQSLPQDARQLLTECGHFALGSIAFAAQQKQTLSDIMLTQDFQDLSGQVIKKVIDMITRTEGQLVQLLIDEGDGEVAGQPVEATLEGPQTPDVALGQGDVDDLLASMGF